jgi:hypothetical protein
MRIDFGKTVLALVLFEQGVTAQLPLPEPLTNRSIVQLAAAGFSEDYLIALIGRSRTQFDSSVQGFANLQAQGINDRIVGAMLAAPGTPSTAAITPKLEQDVPATTAPSGNSILNLWGLFRKFGIGAPHKSALVAAKVQSGGRGAGVIQIESEELSRGIQGLAYSAEIRISLDGRCPQSDSSLFLASGTLPRGVRTTAEGLAGVPMEMGLFRFWIGARNTCATTTRAFELLVTGRPILRALPDRIEITVSPDSPPVNQTVVISSTWPSLPYGIFPREPSWLNLRPVQGATPEASSAFTGDRAIVTAAPLKLAPGIHHGTIIVSAWRADPITIDVTVTVTMPKPPPEPGPWNTSAPNPTLPAQLPQ